MDGVSGVERMREGWSQGAMDKGREEGKWIEIGRRRGWRMEKWEEGTNGERKGCREGWRDGKKEWKNIPSLMLINFNLWPRRLQEARDGLEQ